MSTQKIFSTPNQIGQMKITMNDTKQVFAYLNGREWGLYTFTGCSTLCYSRERRNLTDFPETDLALANFRG